MADGEQKIEKPVRLRGGAVQQVLWTEKDGAVFDEHGDGNSRLKARVRQARKQGMGGSVPGTGRSDQPTGVEDNSQMPASSTILISSGVRK